MKNRYDRQERIERWRQQALRTSCVLVLGAGALGNELIKNLALAGVGHMVVMDFDRVEFSNLSRTVLFRDADVRRPKALVAASAASELNPDLNIQAVDGDLFFDLGLGFYRHADIVVSGLDNIAARSHAGICCSLAGTPFLDGAMWAMGGEVRWFLSGNGPCFECTLTDEDRERASGRLSCHGLGSLESPSAGPPLPATVSTTAVIGGIMAQEVVRYLCNWEVNGGEAIVYNGVDLAMHRSVFTRDPRCNFHNAYEGVIELDSGVAEMSVAALLERAEQDLGAATILELGRDFLLEFYCRECDAYEKVERPLGRVNEAGRICRTCKSLREPMIISRLERDDPQAGKPLLELGVPPGEILGVRAGERLRLFELTGDVNAIWP